MTDWLAYDAAAQQATTWLGRSDGTRLLVLTGPDSNAFTRLSAQLVLWSADEELPAPLRIHAQSGVRGLDPRVTAWALAAQLGMCVRGPDDLISLLSADRRPATVLIAELDASGPAGDGAGRAALVTELLRPLLSIPRLRLIVSTRDPDTLHALCADQSATVIRIAPAPAEPAAVEGAAPLPLAPYSAAQRATGGEVDTVEAPATDPRTLATASQPNLSVALGLAGAAVPGNIRALWKISGQALAVGDLAPPRRAALLHAAALGLGDLETARGLEPFLAAAPFTARWASFASIPSERGAADSRWVGPIRAIDAGRGEFAGTITAVDALGRVQLLDPADGAALGRIPHPPLSAHASAALATGALLIANPDGQITLLEPPDLQGEAESSGLADVLDPDRSPRSRLRSAIAVLHASPMAPVTALACSSDGRTLAVGGSEGVIRILDMVGHEILLDLARLNAGPVTAVAVATPPGEGDLVVISGGLDGRLEVAMHGRRSDRGLVDHRNAPVTAIATNPSLSLVCTAWADGRITLRSRLGEHRLDSIDLGWVPTALHLGDDGCLFVGGLVGIAALQLGPDTLDAARSTW